MSWVHERLGGRFKTDPRILAVGPAARATDIGGIVSVPIEDGKLTHVDTWAGRGGLGSQLFQAHGIVAVIYGGTVIDDDFRDRNVANQWFEDRYHKRMAAKDMEATVKYRFDEKLDTGGTLGANYTKIGGGLMAFNYDTIFATEADRKALHGTLIRDHYLRQFNEDLKAAPKSQTMRNCGEPCVAVCKKMRDIYKKDYEPYQVLGPLSGVFDQRAAEQLNHHGDAMGFDAISLGGVVSWLMGCLAEGVMKPEELGVPGVPVWKAEGFSAEADSHHNARIGIALIDGILARRSALDLSGGARRLAKKLALTRGRKVLDLLVFTANGRHGWMVPNQYWTPGVLSPMPIMGKYYNHYASEYLPPRALGRMNVDRMKMELIMDNGGFCRFHRGWAEEMIPDLIGDLFGKKQEFIDNASATARLINRRNAAVFWESERNVDYVRTSLLRMHELGGGSNPDLAGWVDRFQKDKWAAGFDYWFEVRKGIEEAFTETF
jgi:glyceraldehyde-3-phosphate dehydrogenase (ferredoxin)